MTAKREYDGCPRETGLTTLAPKVCAAGPSHRSVETEQVNPPARRTGGAIQRNGPRRFTEQGGYGPVAQGLSSLASAGSGWRFESSSVHVNEPEHRLSELPDVSNVDLGRLFGDDESSVLAEAVRRTVAQTGESAQAISGWSSYVDAEDPQSE